MAVVRVDCGFFYATVNRKGICRELLMDYRFFKAAFFACAKDIRKC